MTIDLVSHVNEDKNRVEYLFVNFDFFDGNEIIAKKLKENYGMDVIDKTDGIFFNTIKLKKGKEEYCLMWHEDVGNYAYTLSQDRRINKEFKNMLNETIRELNDLL